ncbi:phosphatidylinositol phosphatase PTPRQ [Aphis craccivora]|uniref:Phosphatidylinositol phosphatase PTPRQ n=1 Tax=Aphis craccivora TaxID=307492 RepID=A0A6G0ZP62_APHCR|nr:phosphatidylinositol phosphatase PTPRQ [Aphis craccivora]
MNNWDRTGVNNFLSTGSTCLNLHETTNSKQLAATVFVMTTTLTMNIHLFNNFFITLLTLLTVYVTVISTLRQPDSEQSDECIDFTMIITTRNNAPISNFGGGFRCKSEYPWCIIEVKSKHFPTVFKKIEKNKKKMTEKREFLCETSF